jgi:hypothetical protein
MTDISNGSSPTAVDTGVPTETPRTPEAPAPKRDLKKVAVVAVAVLVWVVVTPLVWKDLRHRPPDQVRGSKRMWRLASANLVGSLAYLVIGRKRVD